MTNPAIRQNDLDDLSAFLDGELDSAAAARIERLLQTDPAWASRLDQLKALDKALETADIPTAPGDLPEQVIASVRKSLQRRERFVWKARIGAGLAAAAAVAIVAIVIISRGGSSAPHKPTAPLVAGKISGADEEFIIQHLDFYRDMEVAENYETLEAIERLEASQTGT